MGNENITVELASTTNTLDPVTHMQRVHLFKLGIMHARDGRMFRLDDPIAVIKETLRIAGKADRPIDFDHQTEFSHENGRPALAAGWMKRFEANEEGIWAIVEWTDIAAEMIQRKQYRYISPTFQTDKRGKILYILRAALTNIPALELTQIASITGEQKMPDDLTFQNKTASILGLNGDADEATILNTLQTLVNADKTIDGDDLKAVTSVLETLNTERGSYHMARVRNKVENAIRSGSMPPSMRNWMTRLCSTDEQAFDEMIAKVGTPFSHLFKNQISDEQEMQLASRNGSGLSHSADDKVAKQLGIDTRDMTT